MLIIRQEQIDTLVMEDEEKFVDFLVRHVKEENPNLKEKYDDAALKKMARGGIERAKSHDFSTAEDITAFVAIMFRVAPNFDGQPEIKAVLDDKNTPPEERIDKLWSSHTSEEDWEEAKNNYNENAWTFRNSERDAENI